MGDERAERELADDELDEARSRLILHDFPLNERPAKTAVNPPDWAAR